MLPQFQQFIDERRFITNVSPSTIKWYEMSLRRLSTETPTSDDIKDLVVRLRKEGRHIPGINCKLRAIRAYCRWAGLQTVVPRLKEDQRAMPTFSPEQVKKLLRWNPRTVTQHRLQTMVAFLFDSGARIDEVLSLRWSDVEIHDLLLLLHGKGRKDRRVPMSLELRKRLFAWQRQHPHGLVFGTMTSNKQGQRNVLRDVKALCSRLGFEPPARTIHAFRHTLAINYLRRGGSVFHLQKILGHTTLDMTRRYANLVISDLSAVHEKLSLLS